MSADRWRQVRLHEALEVLLARHRKNFSHAEVREVEQAILALREAEDQRGAAARELPAANSARCDEGNPSSAGTPSLLTSAKQPAQSAPHHPGGRPVAWTTALALEYAKSAPLSFDVSPMNLWGEKGIPLYTHPGGQGHESSRSQSEDSSARESVADSPASPGLCCKEGQ